jgi:hypothetical protein
MAIDSDDSKNDREIFGIRIGRKLPLTLGVIGTVICPPSPLMSGRPGFA